MPSNLPPGVTGNEPAITGEIEFDPHAPFWPGEVNPGYPEEGFGVFWGASENYYFEHFPTEDAAELFADELNMRYSLRDEHADKDGRCKVCNDYHGELPREGD